jgi:Bardet-Biedl syndrome 9 protein
VDAGTRVMVRLAGMKFNLSEANTTALMSHMAADSHECVEQGWEDTVDASITFMLKTCLAKTVKETAQMAPVLETVDNFEKFAKHVTIVFDRLSKGALLVQPKNNGAGNTESKA